LTVDFEVAGRARKVKLTLVDLAGSERLARTDSDVREARFINGSLSSLGNVIKALGNSTSDHVPFRDSVLTKTLQDSLSHGNASLIATVAGSLEDADETFSTLTFADRCSKAVAVAPPPPPAPERVEAATDETAELRRRLHACYKALHAASSSNRSSRWSTSRLETAGDEEFDEHVESLREVEYDQLSEWLKGEFSK
jgi:hypothetical protein